MKVPPTTHSKAPGAATRIDGKQVAQNLQTQVKKDVAAFKAIHSFAPGLAVCMVGQDPASQIYVKKKSETLRELGMQSFEHTLTESTTTKQLLELIHGLNENPKVHGILVQLPLPKQIDANQVFSHLDPQKDIDGFHAENVGLLSLGDPRFVPCTPLGIMKLLEAYEIRPEGLHAVVIGRSNIVGKPIAQLLLQQNATVTIAHSKTKNLDKFLSQADLLVAAIGKPEMIRGDSLKPGVVVIDVGINRLPTGKLVGDVHFASAAEKASYITPVPGGVGPMTIACLMRNTLTAAQQQVSAKKK